MPLGGDFNELLLTGVVWESEAWLQKYDKPGEERGESGQGGQAQANGGDDNE